MQPLRRSNRITNKTPTSSNTNDTKLQDKRKRRKKENDNTLFSSDTTRLSNEDHQVTMKNKDIIQEQDKRKGIKENDNTLFSSDTTLLNDNIINEDHQITMENMDIIREKFTLNTELLSEEEEEESNERKNFFKFLKDQKLTEESDFSSNSDLESEDMDMLEEKEQEYTSSCRSLLNQGK